LPNGGEMKFIPGTEESPEPHALEAMVDFEVGKSHLNALALVT
jgi:hypothetical protein